MDLEFDEEDIGVVGDNALSMLRSLAIQQKDCEVKVAQCEQELAAAKEELRQVSEVQLPELLDELGMEEFTTKEGLKIKVKEVIRASMGRSDEEKERALNWLDENGFGAIIKRTVEVPFNRGADNEAKQLRDELRKDGLRASFSRKVEPSTLRAFIVEKLTDGEEIPLDIFKVFRDRKTQVEV